MLSDSGDSRDLGDGGTGCPLPTAVLSAQTGFPSYYYDDYTAHMEEIMDQWEKMDFRPNGIYTGFLAGDVQAEMALEFIERFADADTRILTDPILGDNGMEYPIYTEALCEKMRQLAEKASMITQILRKRCFFFMEKKKCIAGGSIYPAWKQRRLWLKSGKPDRRSQRTFIQKQ